MLFLKVSVKSEYLSVVINRIKEYDDIKKKEFDEHIN